MHDLFDAYKDKEYKLLKREQLGKLLNCLMFLSVESVKSCWHSKTKIKTNSGKYNSVRKAKIREEHRNSETFVSKNHRTGRAEIIATTLPPHCHHFANQLSTKAVHRELDIMGRLLLINFFFLLLHKH